MKTEETGDEQGSVGWRISSDWGSVAVKVGLLLGLVLFWDDLLDLSWTVIHLLLEILELGADDFLEVLLGVEKRTAEVYTAWIGLILFILLGGYLYFVAKRAFRRQFRSWGYFRIWVRHWLRERWPYVGFLLVLLIAVNLLL